MVARLPDKEAFIPFLILRSRANHEAIEPESAERIQLSGNRLFNSQNKYCGLIGSAVLWARASITSHHLAVSLIICSCQLGSVFRFNIGINSRRVSLLSPHKCTFIG